MKRILIITFSIALVMLISCKKDVSNVDLGKIPIVTVDKETLYMSDLYDAIPRNLSGEDSIEAAQAYIKMWINEKLLYNKAKENVTNQEEINNLVNEYKKSLITNSYQEQLIEEKFSKTIPDKDLAAYFDQNKDKIKLKENIVKGLFLKIPIDSKELANFQKWYKQGTDASLENIEKKRLQNAVGYDYFYNNWVSLSSMTENMPLPIVDEEQFLKTNKNIEVRDSSFVYLLNIKEYKLSGSEPPFDYIKNQLKDIYLEQQRSGYLKQVIEDLYNKAVSDDEIKFHDNKL